MPGTGNGHRQLQEPLARGEASSCGNWGSINPVGKLRHGGVGLSRVPSVSPQAVTWCQGSVFLEQQQPTVELSCEKAPAAVRRGRNGSVSPPAVPRVPSSSPPKSDSLSSQFGRTWKSKIKGVFGKIKQRFRGFFQCGRIWIRDRLNLKAPEP